MSGFFVGAFQLTFTNKLTIQPIKIHLFGKLKVNKHCIISNALIEKDMCHIEPFVLHQLYYPDLAYG